MSEHGTCLHGMVLACGVLAWRAQVCMVQGAHVHGARPHRGHVVEVLTLTLTLILTLTLTLTRPHRGHVVEVIGSLPPAFSPLDDHIIIRRCAVRAPDAARGGIHGVGELQHLVRGR